MMTDLEPTFHNDLCNADYRFAYDIVMSVLQYRDQWIKVNYLPVLDTYLLTPERKDIILNFLNREKYNIEFLIEIFLKTSSEENYNTCKIEILRRYGSEPISMEAFLCCSAALAYVAGDDMKKQPASTFVFMTFHVVHNWWLTQRNAILNQWQWQLGQKLYS
ncbi:hypothetical protein CEXT_752411 [Caerostris extrusa]|uniref:Uncharacterized protein n=1 Tax=Caerostris extrusa TaxID=172846 RepID=A0AAV4S8V8_CAEEX|nr:hypothetical protein CEXT_752411 [Caerostris extrusa]